MTLIDFLIQMGEHCGVSSDTITISTSEEEDRLMVQINLPEEESGRFIGYHGDGLAAIQRISRLIFEEQYEGKRISVNINDYRQRREAQLSEKTAEIASRVLATGRPFTFHQYLPSHERFVVHSTLSTLPEAEMLESVSSGDGAQRRLTIKLKQN